MAGPAQRLKIAVLIRPAMRFGFDVVNRSCRDWPAVAQTLLADVPITFKDAGADDIPLTAVAALVAAQPSLVLLPAFITVSLAVTRTVCSSAGTSALAASSRDSGWHSGSSNKKATSKTGGFMFMTAKVKGFYLFRSCSTLISAGMPR